MLTTEVRVDKRGHLCEELSKHARPSTGDIETMIKECISDFMKQEPARGVGHAGSQQQAITDTRMITAA
eukprot:5738784-Pyramimonas_sp.AAC.1